MQEHLIIDFLAACPGAIQVREPPFEPSLRLSCAKHPPLYYKSADAGAIISSHDALDALVVLVEIRTTTPLTIPIKTGRCDLFWCYQPIGDSVLTSSGSDLPHRAIGIAERQHVQVYSEPCTAGWTIVPDHVVIQLHIVKRRWASRYEHAHNLPLEFAIRCLEAERQCACHTHVAPFDQTMEDLLKQIRAVPCGQGMGVDGDVQQPIGHLADWHRGIGLEMVQEEGSDAPEPSTPDERFTLEVQGQIRAWIAQEKPFIPRVGDVGKKFHANAQYLHVHYRKDMVLGISETCKQFIIRATLEEAKQLMVEKGFTVSQVSAHLDYPDMPSFIKQFKKAYGMTPTQFLDSVKEK